MIYYVDVKAFHDGDGSMDRPFKHIVDAAVIAVAGDEILVTSGIYRAVEPVPGPFASYTDDVALVSLQ